MVQGTPGLEHRLAALLLRDEWFLSVLEHARSLTLPDWVVGAGAIRSTVWDHLHELEERTPVKDVDLAYFDPIDVSLERDRALETELRRQAPEIPWDVTNQAGVHLWYEARFGNPMSQPIASIEDGISRWSETAASVGVRLASDDSIVVIAPCGLEDLFDMVFRRNPKQMSVETFRHRVATKGIEETWPRVTIVAE
ncbi:MAG TPA: nucleotidyltransferase family protein [Actinomycetota bacterium]|nr:nucleotidyltransferase family protein [Actinomycetota bacterium]